MEDLANSWNQPCDIDPNSVTIALNMGTPTKWDNLLGALFGNTRCAVLALLFGRGDESFFLRQIVRATGGGLGAVQRELKRLGEAGIISRQVRDQHVYYQANRDCPIFSELHGLVVKTAGVADVLRAALKGLGDRIEVAFVYGSIAKGTAKAPSDVDLMVIGEVTFGEVVAALGPAQEKLGREINPSVYPPAEFCRKLTQGHHFLTTVLNEPKIFLCGGEHELGRLVDKRLVNGTPNQSTRNRRPVRRGRS